MVAAPVSVPALVRTPLVQNLGFTHTALFQLVALALLRSTLHQSEPADSQSSSETLVITIMHPVFFTNTAYLLPCNTLINARPIYFPIYFLSSRKSILNKINHAHGIVFLSSFGSRPNSLTGTTAVQSSEPSFWYNSVIKGRKAQ